MTHQVIRQIVADFRIGCIAALQPHEHKRQQQHLTGSTPDVQRGTGAIAMVELRDLASSAGQCDQDAWNTIVHRFMPLVWSITRRFQLSEEDEEDVSQTVWLRLAQRIETIREARALPGWISTTTRNEALNALKSKRRNTSIDPRGPWIAQTPVVSDAVDANLLRAERHQALRDGLAELEPHQRDSYCSW